MFWKTSKAPGQRQTGVRKKLCHPTWYCHYVWDLEVAWDLFRCCPDHETQPDFAWQHQTNNYQLQENSEPYAWCLPAQPTDTSFQDCHKFTILWSSCPLHCFQSVANVSKLIFLFPRKMIRSCPSYTDLSSALHRDPTHPELKHRIRLLQGMSQQLLIYSQNLRQGLLLPFPLSRIWGTHPTLGHRDRVVASSLQTQLGPVQTTLPFYSHECSLHPHFVCPYTALSFWRYSETQKQFQVWGFFSSAQKENLHYIFSKISCKT